jgi:hypothetical protein
MYSFRKSLVVIVGLLVVSLRYTPVEMKVLNPVLVQSWSTTTGISTSVETKVLRPVLVDQDCTTRDHMSGEIWCKGNLEPYGKACTGSEGSIGANSIKMLSSPTLAPIVGWYDRYDKGSGPFKCPWFVSGFSRAYVKFEVKNVIPSGGGTIEVVEYAALSWKTKRLDGTQPKACIKYLYEATGMWDRGKTPTVLLASNLDSFAGKAGYYGVVQQVKKWFEHPDQNWGFMIEPSRNFTEQYSSSKCKESVEDLKLTVRYRVKQMQWPR